MGTKHQSSSDPISDNKRRRRVGFSKIDAGIEANECIKVHLVSSKEEIDSPESFQIESVDLNVFFEEEGKIYGYQGLKITVWFSSVSFHAYADISFESSSDGGKGITDLKSSLQNIFGENLVEQKDDFLQTFSTGRDYVKSIVASAEVLQKSSSNCCSDNSHVDVEVFCVRGTAVGHLYSRLVSLVLLLVDGSNPIDVTDPRWEIYIIVRHGQHDTPVGLLGFAVVYRFHRYPEGMRLRLGQILIVPPHQRKGYGRTLIEALNNIAISEDVYDLTIEEPVDSLQHMRTCIDVQRLLAFDPINYALNPVISRLKNENLSKKSQSSKFGPSKSITEEIRKILKINKRQFIQCWEILIYIGLDPMEKKYMDNYEIIVSDRIKADVIGKESEGEGKRLLDIPTEFDQEMSFAMFKSKGGEAGVEKDEIDQGNLQEQLKQLVDMRMKEIKSVAEKMSVRKF